MGWEVSHATDRMVTQNAPLASTWSGVKLTSTRPHAHTQVKMARRVPLLLLLACHTFSPVSLAVAE